jgi:hypothetical protein
LNTLLSLVAAVAVLDKAVAAAQAVIVALWLAKHLAAVLLLNRH